MLAGCSSTLLSPRHRLRSEASAQFQACHIPAMTTQRLDLPCSFGRKEASSRPQPVRQIGISVDKGIESKSSLRESIKLPPVAAKRGDEFCARSKKRYAATDERSNYMGRVKKRKNGNGKCVEESGMSKDVHPHREVSASGSSSTSSGSHNLALGLGSSNPTVEREAAGNGSSSRNPSEVVAGHNGSSQREPECVELINLVVACVEQIGSKNIAAVSHCLARLGELASPRGSPLHRLIAYFTEALALRVARLWPQVFHITPPRELEHVDDDALRVLNQVSPITKFVHFTCNEILLRALEGKDRVHIIDFDIKQGLQWPSLFQSLASRASPPSHVRITGIGESKQELMETGDRLAGFAEAFNLPFQFHPVVDRLEDVRLWMLHVKEKETVVANSVFQLHKMLYEGSALREFLGLIRSSNAQVVVMAEQEAAHNEATFDARLFNSLKYYSAVFDSIDSNLTLESPSRMKIEEMFGREIRNIIGCEGRQRFERHEKFDKWQQLMEQGGFRCVGVSERELLQGQMMLKMYSSNHNYRVEVQQGSSSSSSMILSWSDQPLYAVSAWAPVNGGGGSSSLPR
ncbi:scarecrow-like protein 28 isoform X2 [Salvia splendens]|uniref:scarecrow-like protein 28 isoform X2 n=1 Tax=Salvia splendens TaxID=180675 RepID=UPI001C26EEE3|nr:scarecrow-like protein 28 isoform X2 [Salvia splendens]